MVDRDYKIGSIIKFKKQHPCGSASWEIVRMGMDIKVKCKKCERLVMMPRREFEKKLKQVLEY